MKDVIYRSKEAFNIFKNLPGNTAADAANYWDNINATINRRFRTGIAINILFETLRIA